MARLVRTLLVLGVLAGVSSRVSADEVSDWNAIMFAAALKASPPTSPLNMGRVAAIVESAVFDAVNGIERRFAPIHVIDGAADRGASRRAAAIQAAYTTLVALYPAQKTSFDEQRDASLANISSGAAAENSVSIQRGVEWGDTVAKAMLAWRDTDGFKKSLPPFTGSTDIGHWRPTPPAKAPGVGEQYATMTPWVIEKPSAFRPGPPPALTSTTYANDFSEVKLHGAITAALSDRSADQTAFSTFWAVSTATAYWDRITESLAAEQHLTFSENARLLALVNLAMADASIGCWDAKYLYTFWRPVTAIPLADLDGNAATVADPNWQPLLATPAHPEYPSGHSCVSGAAGHVLSRYFGDATPFSVTSDVMKNADGSFVTRSFESFSATTDEIKNARIYAGIHFRTATNVGQTLGVEVADYILEHALLPVDGNHTGQLRR